MEIIVGTYENLVLGYKLQQRNGKYSLELSFTNNSHLGAIRCIAASSGGILASGSSDECIHLFNLKKRIDLGSLFFHKGSINCLQFYKSSHLFSGSDDNDVAVWQAGSWERQKTLTGHKESISSVAVHPTGKLGLSVSKDRTMFTWDLIRGRRGYVKNLKQVAENISWSPDGSKFIITYSNSFEVYSTETANAIHQLQPEFRISSVVFIMPSIAAVGGAGGLVKFYNVETGSLLAELETETVRIKSMVVVPGSSPSEVMLVIASSDGFLKVIKVSEKNDDISCALLTEVQTNFRLICCTVYEAETSESEESTTEVPESHTSEMDVTESENLESASGVHITKDSGSVKVIEKQVKPKTKKASNKNPDELEALLERKKMLRLKKKQRLQKLKDEEQVEKNIKNSADTEAKGKLNKQKQQKNKLKNKKQRQEPVESSSDVNSKTDRMKLKKEKLEKLKKKKLQKEKRKQNVKH